MKKIYIYLIILTSIIQVPELFSQSFSASANPTVFSSDVITGVTWANGSNSNNSDNQRCNAGMFINLVFSINTDYLITEGYGFTIPTSAVIEGIEVKLEKRGQGINLLSSVSDNSLQLIKGGVRTGSVKCNNSNWPSSDVTVTYGGPTDLWGTTWQPSDINSPTFGCAFSAKLSTGIAGVFLEAQIDEIEIIVHYSVAPLNISLHYFDAFLMDNNTVKLKWITETEHNNDHFVIQYSTDALNWNDKARIKGAGNSTSPITYECNDEDIITGLCYYRLKQVDFDGTENLHRTVSVNVLPTKGSVLLRPNPVKDRLLFNCVKQNDASLVIYLYDMRWNQVKKSEEQQLRKNVVSPVEMEIPELEKGVYFYKAVMGDEILTGQVVKED
jgi:hypothetical protein